MGPIAGIRSPRAHDGLWIACRYRSRRAGVRLLKCLRRRSGEALRKPRPAHCLHLLRQRCDRRKAIESFLHRLANRHSLTRRIQPLSDGCAPVCDDRSSNSYAEEMRVGPLTSRSVWVPFATIAPGRPGGGGWGRVTSACGAAHRECGHDRARRAHIALATSTDRCRLMRCNLHNACGL